MLAVTGESTFDLPTEPAVAVLLPASAPGPEPAAEEALPDGWEARVSSSTGETYFFNTVTQESEWDRPTTGAQRP